MMIDPDSPIDTLEVFDFDWTLFRSPHPPEGHPPKTWWASEESLLPPHVPIRAPRSFWIEEIVREMKASQRSRSRLPVVITSRRGKTRDRVQELLAQRSLEPEAFYCRHSSFSKDKSSTGFKRATVARILMQCPTICRVIVWEDAKEQIAELKDLAKKRKVDFEANLVTEAGRK
jgi:hypothetical protein